MTEQCLIVDVTDMRLRLQCRCGSAISVAPAELKETVLYCTNCDTGWPDYQGASHPGGPVTKFVKVLHALATTVQDIPEGYHVQFEVERPS